MNKIVLGDNLEILKNIDSESVDLIYIDPPFFSNRTYEVIWGDKGEVRSFEDRFSGGIDHYIAWLKERVVEMHRILKPTGSFFLHCDYHADAYIRVLILDKVFGANNFRNEIIWKRKTGKGETNHKSNKFGIDYDTIFYYAKSNKNVFYSQFTFDDENYQEYLDSHFKYEDENGRKYRIDNLASPSYRENLIYEYKGYKPPKNGWAISKEKMEEWDKEGRLYFPKKVDGRIQRKRYLDEVEGKPIQSVWDDIKMVSPTNPERIGYPTQKPEALLERIIKCASNEGDVVMDCFVGGGTTIAVADKLKRKWIGIDQSVQAVKVTEFRLNAQQDLFSAPFVVELHKYDYDTLRYKEAFDFETWIIEQFGGIPNKKQRGDLGLDGRTKKDNTPIQVKRSDNIGRNVVDNFFAAVQRYDKALFEKNKQANLPVGYIIAFTFGKGAVQEVARLKNEENVIITLVTVDTIVPLANKPNLKVTIQDLGKVKDLREIAFEAMGKSDTGIEFYAWDFSYDNTKFSPDVFFDKEGKQTHSFKAGIHQIAVKAIDNEGLESIEVVKLKVNGVVERKEV